MNHVADCGIIVFLRNPESGKVKTRIASTMGDEEALEIYNELIRITLNTVRNLPMQVYLFYDSSLPEKSDRSLSFQYYLQTEGDLGERMLNAFEIVLGQHEKAIIIGSDCPSLTSIDLENARHALHSYDVVIGPSADGGYYLLGCKDIIPQLFHNIHWSTPLVLDQTKDALDRMQIKYQLLQTLNDIDTEEDWIKFQNVRT